MKNNKKWFSLPLAMGLVIIISLLAYTILEYIVPFSRDVKWIENASKAYYQANSWIEDALLYIKNRADETWEDFKSFTDKISYSYSTFSSWTILPPSWEWNSEYNKDWNIISEWNPLQLSLWNGYLWTWDLKIYFRVPDLNRDWDNSDLVLSWSLLPIVSWQLSAEQDVLNSSDSIIKANQIDEREIILNNLIWDKLDTTGESMWSFYSTNCNSNWDLCSLKLSIVNKLESDDIISPVSIPYLEWKIVSDNNIPLRYTKLQASWKSIWYKKNLDIKVETNTTNQAFDFTVFQ